jgi:ribosomal protein L31
MSTYSAGTYDYKICVGCEESGTIVVESVSAPHPVYTDGQNNSIIQTTAVALGGFNGLNN